MNIRDAQEADLPAIIEIYNESIPAGRSTADTRPVTVEERREWFQKFDPKTRPIWVAEDAGQIVGCIYLSWFYEGRPAYDQTAEVSTYIRASHQGKGLGTELKRRMIAACPSLGVENLISLYFDHNEATKRLNNKFGFEPAGHLEKIATIHSQKRGLILSILRIPKAGHRASQNS